MRFKINTNFDSFTRNLENSREQALIAAVQELNNTALSVESTAKQNIKNNKTVDTGRLLGSINTKLAKVSTNATAEVGTNVEYANYIEYGTSKMGAKPFLNPALMLKLMA